MLPTIVNDIRNFVYYIYKANIIFGEKVLVEAIV